MAANDQEFRGRVEGALNIAMQSGGVEGSHHKAWVIDQMVRALTGCPTIQQHATDVHGTPYSYDALGESAEYLEFVRMHREGEDGSESYDWDVGTAP